MSRLALSLLLASLATPLAAAQFTDAHYSTAFHRPGLGGRVFALGAYGNDLVAGGRPFRSEGQVFDHVARWDTQHWSALGGGLQGGDVRSFTEFQGELIAGGGFFGAGGQPASAVAAFDGVHWHPLGQGLDLSYGQAVVYALEVFQGALYAGGLFDGAGGQPAQGLARWDGTQWQPVGALGGPLEPTVYALKTIGTRLYVGGSFDSIGGVPAQQIASFDGNAFAPLGPGIPAPLGTAVWDIEPFQNRVYVCGNFGQAGGAAKSKAIAAWDGAQWHGVGGGIPDWDIGITAYALETFQGELYVGGNFVSVAGGAVPASRVARWDGAAWHPAGSGGGVSGADIITTVFDLRVSGGRLFAGGEFDLAGTSFGVGEPVVSTQIASFDGQTWAVVGEGLGLDAEPFHLATWNGGLVAAGRFTRAGTELSTTVAWLKDGAWNVLGNVNGQVRFALEYQGDLVIVGSFTQVSGTFAKKVARWDGAQWHGFGGGLSQDALCAAVFQNQLYVGGIGAPMRWTGTQWQTFGQPLFGAMLTMHVHQGALYIGGSIGQFGGFGSNLVRWDGVTVSVAGGGTDDTVNVLTSWNGSLLAGGEFKNAGGVPVTGLAAWNGTTWSALAASAPLGAVQDLVALGPDLYVSGNPLLMVGNTFHYFARYVGASGGGSGWEVPGEGINGVPLALLADESAGALYAGGIFSKAGGKPASYLTRIGPPPVWKDLGLALPGVQGAPSLQGQGNLVPGTPVTLSLANARPNAAAALIAGLSRIDVPLYGGTLVPGPSLIVPGLPLSASGTLQLGAPWPAGLPSGTDLFFQFWIQDPAGPQGFSASNGLQATSP